VLYSSTMQFIQPILKLIGAGYDGHAVPCGLRAGRVKSEDPRRYTRMQAQYTDTVSRMQLAVSTSVRIVVTARSVGILVIGSPSVRGWLSPNQCPYCSRAFWTFWCHVLLSNRVVRRRGPGATRPDGRRAVPVSRSMLT
jgi:hypothetical protein